MFDYSGNLSVCASGTHLRLKRATEHVSHQAVGRVEGHFSPTPAVEGDGGAPGPAVGEGGVLAELSEIARQVRVPPGQFQRSGNKLNSILLTFHNQGL